MYEMLFCFCILLHWRVFLPLVESSCQIWFPMLTFAFLSLPLLRKTDVKIRKQTEKRETKRKQETVFYVFLRVSLANIGKFKLSLKALILSAFTFICFLVFSNAFRRTKIFLTSCSSLCGLSTQRHTHLAVGGFRVLAPKPYLHVSMYTAFH